MKKYIQPETKVLEMEPTSIMNNSEVKMGGKVSSFTDDEVEGDASSYRNNLWN